MTFIPIEKQRMPIDIGEAFFLVAHPYGVEYVYWSKGELKFAYTGRPVFDILPKDIITHWCIPQNPNTYKPNE